MAVDIAFWILAVVCVGSALAVVLLRDIFRAALFLVLCFFVIAGIYLTLNADFLAGVQVLIYVGAIAVLIIFAIMFTRETQQGNPSNRLKIPVLLLALLLLGTMIFSMVDTTWPPITGISEEAQLSEGEPTTSGIADLLFGENGFILPFEIAAVLLLAAIIGAIVMARER
jgi:NADH-quinone oxidoreductase subunit J